MRMNLSKSTQSTNSQYSSVSFEEIYQLRNLAQKQQKSNQIKFQQLLHYNKNEDIKQLTFVTINKPIRSTEILQQKRRLLKIIDILIHDFNELNKIQRNNLQEIQERQELKQKTQDSYAFMRNLFASLNNPKDIQYPLEERLDRLNKIVSSLKSNILRKLNYERKQQMVPVQIDDLLENRAYENLKQKYENCKMRIEQIEQKSIMRLYSEQFTQERITLENQNLRRQAKDYKNRIKALEKQVISIETNLQQITQKFNKLSTETEKKQKIGKSIYKNANYQLHILQNGRLQDRAIKHTDKTLQSVINFLEQVSFKQMTFMNKSMIQPEIKKIQDQQRPSFVKRQSQGFLRLEQKAKRSDSNSKYSTFTLKTEEIKNVRFTRTNTNAYNLKRKPTEINPNFFTKVQDINKLLKQ